MRKAAFNSTTTTYPQQHAEGSAEVMPKSLRIRWGEGKDMDKVKGLDDACDARWFQIDALPKPAFHHEQIINDFLKED